MSTKILNALRYDILPIHYRRDLSDSVGEGMLLFEKGAYVCLVMPFSAIPSDDYGSKTAKGVIRKAFTCIPFFREKGLFLVYYGKKDEWSDQSSQFTVDKTALKPVILQSIHFIDPDSGDNVNSRTHWGPLKFGFCGRLIEDIQAMCQGSGNASNRDTMAGTDQL